MAAEMVCSGQAADRHGESLVKGRWLSNLTVLAFLSLPGPAAPLLAQSVCLGPIAIPMCGPSGHRDFRCVTHLRAAAKEPCTNKRVSYHHVEVGPLPVWMPADRLLGCGGWRLEEEAEGKLVAKGKLTRDGIVI